jgi:hypothetical protein
MAWQFLSILPNLDLQVAIEARHAAIVPAADERVVSLRREHPNLDTFLSRFRTTHGREVSPAVVLRDDEATRPRQTEEAMVGLRNCLSVATLVHQTALDLLYPGRHRVLYSNAFDFYPWSLDRHYDRMMSITPAAMEIHQVKDFSGQPSPGSPIQPVRHYDIDKPVLTELLAHWDYAYERSRKGGLDRALFRSLNMANAAIAMPAVQGLTIFDYGRQCALWISAFEILAHFDAGRNHADLSAVLELLDKKPFLSPSLRPRRYTVRHRGRKRNVQLPMKLYAILYETRNAFLHGNPVTVSDLKLKWSGRPIFQFAPLLYRCALRNFLDLHFVPDERPEGLAARLRLRFDVHDYEEPQVDVEQALRLAKSPPNDDQ